jgi:transcriptional regulator with XRE-family HTH domain
MIDRIQQLMKTYRLSAADLADTLGTERSGISHFLSGRNKPSLAFITKLLEKFPDVNPDWLLMGSGNMLRQDNKTQVQPEMKQPQPQQKPVAYSQPEPEKQPVKEVHDEDAVYYQSKPREKENKQTRSEPVIPAAIAEDNEIERIVIFFNDHSFKTYKMR